MTARISDWKRPELVGRFEQWKNAAPLMAETVPQIFPWNLRGQEAFAEVNKNLDPVWLGEKKLDEGLAGAVRAIDAVLQKPMIK
jgi:hypothetical protein